MINRVYIIILSILANVSRETLLKTIFMRNMLSIGKGKTKYIKKHETLKKY